MPPKNETKDSSKASASAKAKAKAKAPAAARKKPANKRPNDLTKSLGRGGAFFSVQNA